MRRAGDLGAEALVTVLGLGHAPFAPGTFGTFAGVALAGFLGSNWPGWYLPGVLGLALALCLAGAPLGGWAARRFGREDPGAYVLDEVVGFLVAAAWPVFPGWTHLGAAFLGFRLFDIAKPWPCRRLERIKGGWGILLDDLAAGLWTLVPLIVLHLLFPNWFAS